jgi:hypothetical protein
MTPGLFNGDNHCMGDVLIIDHGGIFSLYAHLQGADVADGEWVSEGQHIGRVGRTPTRSRPGCTPPSSAHLHFEVKRYGVLGNRTDDGPYWGYTPGDPSLYDYYDPILFFHRWVVVGPVDIRTAFNVNVRMGPNSTPPQQYRILETVGAGSALRAYALASATAACPGGWYLVRKPDNGFFVSHPEGQHKGVRDGWLCRDFTTTASAQGLEGSRSQRTGIGGFLAIAFGLVGFSFLWRVRHGIVRS